MTRDFNDQEEEDLKQLLYEKIKELDADPEAKIKNSRKRNLADRLDAIYKRFAELRHT